jgi:hypothetical protein
MSWTVRDIVRDRETIDAIEGHDDRAAAVMAGAYLEDRLTSVIKAHVGNGLRSRASFAEKIEAVRQIAIFDENGATVFHAIREIRNEFAHSLSPLTFNTREIVEFCGKLFQVESIRELRSSNSEKFQDSAALLELNSAVLDPLLELPNTPRNTYMTTIKVLLLFLELSKASASMTETDTLELVRGKTPSRG